MSSLETYHALARRVAGPSAAQVKPRLAAPAPGGNGTIVGLVPGAYHRTKRWPPERFRDLMQMVSRRHPDVRFIVIAGEQEADLKGAFPGAEEDFGSTGADLARVISRCRVVVGGDTGLMHLAEAVDVPVVALFGPTIPQTGFGPHLSDSRVLEIELPCRPCSQFGERPCRFSENLCLTRLPQNAVVAALDGFLE